jgi:glyoxylase-like metal-dependent hydrolase (beta-lactamase superfamily II)
VERLVHVYLVTGEENCLVDTGVISSHQPIVDALGKHGFSPADVHWLVNTHSHPDHAGGNHAFWQIAQPATASHIEAARWIEDMDLQSRERPVDGFDELVSGSVQVERKLEDGDEIDLGGVTLEAIHCPGHSPGSIALYCPQDGTLISGDAVPPTGGLPIYTDLDQSRQTLRRLAALESVERVYSSHIDSAFTGTDIPGLYEEGLSYLDRMDKAVAAASAALPVDADLEDLTRAALVNMGFDPPPVMGLTMASVKAHLE